MLRPHTPSLLVLYRYSQKLFKAAALIEMLQTEFNVDDVHVPDVPGMFTTFIVKGKPMFVDPKFFTVPYHYGRLMGYDKPFDFSLPNNTDGKKG